MRNLKLEYRKDALKETAVIVDMRIGVTKIPMDGYIAVEDMEVTIIQAIEMDAFILRNNQSFQLFLR